MIVLKELTWGNIFSYGKDNSLVLNLNPITQVVGANGHGKSSIPLILEEALFSKNSKGIKKADLLNRYIDDKSLFIGLEFSKNDNDYVIKVKRTKTGQTIEFTENGIDISGHTSTSTSKLIEEKLGFSHEIFVSIIYQSSAQAMEFLTSTDTVRKKFLIELLGLEKYLEIFEKFKEFSKNISDQILTAETKVNTIQSWLDKNKLVDTVKQPLNDIPEKPVDLQSQLTNLTAELKNIDDINKQILKNNQYKVLMDKVVLDVGAKAPEEDIQYLKQKAVEENIKKEAEKELKHALSLKDTCPTCKQPVDISFVPNLIETKKAIISQADSEIARIQKILDDIAIVAKRFNKAQAAQQDFEKYSSLYDSELVSDILDKEEIDSKITAIQVAIREIEKQISDAILHNNKVSAKNAQIDVILEQTESMKGDLESITISLNHLKDKSSNLEILKKAFSTSGLLAYKIECLVKDLECIVNDYLLELSDGRFQLSFTVSNDKLNIVITDNGNDIEISALSNGEKARINTATLLAIRHLMQALSSTKINLLILDETIDSLDTYGKEKLVEILLKQHDLNTFLISHSFTHPLMPQVMVIKENNISRIE